MRANLLLAGFSLALSLALYSDAEAACQQVSDRDIYCDAFDANTAKEAEAIVYSAFPVFAQNSYEANKSAWSWLINHNYDNGLSMTWLGYGSNVFNLVINSPSILNTFAGSWAQFYAKVEAETVSIFARPGPEDISITYLDEQGGTQHTGTFTPRQDVLLTSYNIHAVPAAEAGMGIAGVVASAATILLFHRRARAQSAPNAAR